MSTITPVRQPLGVRTESPARRKPTSQPRPRLVLVTKPRSSAARLPFLILIGAILVAGLVGVLLLHMLAAQDAYRATALQSRLGVLTDQEQRLSTQVERDSAPSALRARAKALGMVATTVGSFHKLHDGRAVGVQTPVYVPPPTPVTTAPAKPTPTTSATAKAGTAAKSTGRQATTATAKHNGATQTKSPATKPSKKAGTTKPGQPQTSPKHQSPHHHG